MYLRYWSVRALWMAPCTWPKSCVQFVYMTAVSWREMVNGDSTSIYGWFWKWIYSRFNNSVDLLNRIRRMHSSINLMEAYTEFLLWIYRFLCIEPKDLWSKRNSQSVTIPRRNGLMCFPSYWPPWFNVSLPVWSWSVINWHRKSRRCSVTISW